MEELKLVEFLIRGESYVEALKLLNTIIYNMTYKNDFLTPCLMARKRELERLLVDNYEPDKLLDRFFYNFKTNSDKLKFILEGDDESTSRRKIN